MCYGFSQRCRSYPNPAALACARRLPTKRAIRRFADLPTLKLQKLAVLLDQVAGAQDLCFEVLRVVDAREGTNLAGGYLRAVA